MSKEYGGLRPLRIAELRVAAGERVAILGFDQPSAEVFVNLATGATLPDAGEVSVFGRATSGDRRQRRLAGDGRSVRHRQRARRAARRADRDPEPGDAVHARNRTAARPMSGSAPKRWRARSDWPRRRGPGRWPSSTRPGGCACASAARLRWSPAILLLEHASARLAREQVAAVGRAHAGGGRCARHGAGRRYGGRSVREGRGRARV